MCFGQKNLFGVAAFTSPFFYMLCAHLVDMVAKTTTYQEKKVNFRAQYDNQKSTKVNQNDDILESNPSRRKPRHQ